MKLSPKAWEIPSDLLANSLHLQRNVQNILDLLGSASPYCYFR